MYIDISLPISPDIPRWPGSSPVVMTRTQPCPSVIETLLQFSAHTGTHIDAPLHFLPGGPGIAETQLDALNGAAHVVHLPGISVITADDLEKASVPEHARRVLLRTGNSDRGQRNTFHEDYVALSPDGAQWIVERSITLIGIDYLSVQRFHDGPETHLILLSAGIVVLEGIHLGGVPPGEYELICLPIRLEACEAAPARAVLKRKE
jgi:arylformamidase